MTLSLAKAIRRRNWKSWKKRLNPQEKLTGEISTDLKDAQALLVKYEAAKKKLAKILRVEKNR